MSTLPILPPALILLPRPLRATHALLLITGALLVPAQSPALTWRWSNPTPHGNSIVDMAWNGNLSVQVAELGQIYTGTDFLGWTPQNSGTTNDLQAVRFFGNRIVFVGANGTVGYSDDGVHFATSMLNTLYAGDWLVDLAASSNLVVAVGDDAIIYTSSDGAAWHYQGQAPSAGSDWLLSAAWGGGTFVVTGEKGYLATSANGTTWTKQASGVSGDLMRVAWISVTNPFSLFPYTGFWAVTDDGKAIYSTNSGSAWHAFDLGPLSTNILYAATANSTSGLLVGDTDVRLGTGLATWSRETVLLPLNNPSPAPSWTYYCALWDSTNGAYRLAGDDGMMVTGTPTNSIYNWQIQYDDISRSLLWQATVENGLYVAVGDDATIMTSDNGGDWSVEYVPQTNSVSISNSVFLCVGGSSNLLIAAGSSGSLAVSPNKSVTVVLTNGDGTLSTNSASSMGVVWYSLPAPTTNDLAGLCTFSNKFYLAGGNATLLTSANGTNWTSVTVTAAGSTDLSGLAASSNTLVAVGDQGLILASSDGRTWSKQTSGTANGLFRVRFLDGGFLALGENGTILKSTTGLSWSSVPSGTTNWLTDAVMVSNVCYVVGNQGTVLASTNLLNWTNVGCITYQSLYGAATQNGQLIVVGLQGTILRSQIIPNLSSPLFFYYYAQVSGDNIFYVSGAPDQQFTLDSSPNLRTWTTGPLLDLIYGSGTLTFLTSVGTNPPPAQFYRATLVP